MDTEILAPDAAQAPAAPLALGPELTIAHAAAWRDALVDALCTTGGDLALDLSGVTDIDSAGLQLLLATRRSVNERGAALLLHGAPPSVVDALAVFGLNRHLDAADTAAGAQP